MRKIIDWVKDRDGMEWFLFISVGMVVIITIFALMDMWENESNRISTGTIIEKEYNDDYGQKDLLNFAIFRTNLCKILYENLENISLRLTENIIK